MKRNKLKIKKGMTLVEVIISVTLLSILLVPLSTIVLSSIKNSKNAEYRQKASYIGQKVIEELKAYDYIKLESDESGEYFKLLDGDKIEKRELENNFIGTFERTIFGAIDETESTKEPRFKVEVIMGKNSNFNNDNIKSNITFEKEADVYKLKINNDISQELIVKDELVFNIKNHEIEIYNRLDSENKIFSTLKGDLVINVVEGYDMNTNVNIINNDDKVLEVSLINEGSSNNVKVNSYKGDIVLSELNNSNLNNISNMYNYEVVVKDSSDKTLFKGLSSSNIIIK